MSVSRHTGASLTSRLGGWLPHDPAHLGRWLKNTLEEAERKARPFHPVGPWDKDGVRSRRFQTPQAVPPSDTAF